MNPSFLLTVCQYARLLQEAVANGVIVEVEEVRQTRTRPEIAIPAVKEADCYERPKPPRPDRREQRRLNKAVSARTKR